MDLKDLHTHRAHSTVSSYSFRLIFATGSIEDTLLTWGVCLLDESEQDIPRETSPIDRQHRLFTLDEGCMPHV